MSLGVMFLSMLSPTSLYGIFLGDNTLILCWEVDSSLGNPSSSSLQQLVSVNTDTPGLHIVLSVNLVGEHGGVD